MNCAPRFLIFFPTILGVILVHKEHRRWHEGRKEPLMILKLHVLRVLAVYWDLGLYYQVDLP
jgi:hypothetical protein